MFDMQIILTMNVISDPKNEIRIQAAFKPDEIGFVGQVIHVENNIAMIILEISHNDSGVPFKTAEEALQSADEIVKECREQDKE